jgi:hypothetical protein
VLTEPFAADYSARVKAARTEVVKKFGAAKRNGSRLCVIAAQMGCGVFNAVSSNQI